MILATQHSHTDQHSQQICQHIIPAAVAVAAAVSGHISSTSADDVFDTDTADFSLLSLLSRRPATG